MTLNHRDQMILQGDTRAIYYQRYITGLLYSQTGLNWIIFCTTFFFLSNPEMQNFNSGIDSIFYKENENDGQLNIVGESSADSCTTTMLRQNLCRLKLL